MQLTLSNSVTTGQGRFTAVAFRMIFSRMVFLVIPIFWRIHGTRSIFGTHWVYGVL